MTISRKKSSYGAMTEHAITAWLAVSVLPSVRSGELIPARTRLPVLRLGFHGATSRSKRVDVYLYVKYN